MKNWFKFFFLSFFSNKQSKEATKRGYANVFLGLILVLVYMCVGVIGADSLPFSTHYGASSGFKTMVRSAFMNPGTEGGVDVYIENGELKARLDGDYKNALIVDTFNNDADKNVYSKDGYQLLIDTRPANSLAEFEAYCVSTDGAQTKISYEDYLTLNDVARQNYAFRLKYTGNEFVLTDAIVEGYKTYVESVNEQYKNTSKQLLEKFTNGEINKSQYDRAIYELYFSAYYPDITEYESTSNVPLLRNYYFHELIDNGEEKFLMVFDDCMVGSFETDGGIDVFFYGFYNSIPDGTLIDDFDSVGDRQKAVDGLIVKSFKATLELSAYIYIMNTVRLVPIMILMGVVLAMLMYSVLSLKGVETLKTFGSALKVVGSYLWVAGLIMALLTMLIAFFVPRGVITIVLMVSFFVVLLIRTIIFVISQIKERKIELEKLAKEAEQSLDIENGSTTDNLASNNTEA